MSTNFDPVKPTREEFERHLEMRMGVLKRECNDLIAMHDRYGYGTMAKSELYKAMGALQQGVIWIQWFRSREKKA